ncbi:MAG: ATP-dependent Clp protease proteolytic subunit [Dehalococcoidia bacterium]
MGMMSEYISRKLSAADLEAELLKLISEYNKLRQTFATVYVAAIGKPIPDVPLNQDDYYLIHDLLRDVASRKVDLYLETPGGSGEAAEEIVRCLRNKFDQVSFVVSGEAKSAGTIMVLSGDEILMTETGSLGPIDAQVRIGRSVVSAYDYLEWTDQKSKEAKKAGKLNPFDATMVAQISPGELSDVFHALKYAEDLVTDWLVRYKFKTWTTTETRQIPVTAEMKTKQAQKIAAELMNHAKWRSHGRSIKATDLQDIGLRVTRVESDPKLSDVVYRIQTVCRLLFSSTNTYKIFATEREKVFKTATPVSAVPIIPVQAADVVEFETRCPKCGKVHKLYAKFKDAPKIDEDFQKKGNIAYPKDNKLKCECGFEIDLGGFRNDIETKIGKKLII